MTWSGYISGSATLYIQGDRVDAQGRETGAIDRPDFRFNASLPATRDRVDVRIRRGRGQVQVIEQPLPDNQYTATVQISPVSDRPEYYVLDFYWDPLGGQSSNRNGSYRDDRENNQDRGGYRARSGQGVASGQVHWTGDVDRQALVTIRGNQVSSRATSGAPVLNEQIDVSSPLPQADNVDLRVVDTSGRGNVQLVESPNDQNGYRAVVRITDPGPGVGSYSFRLVWNANGNYGYNNPNSYSGQDRYRRDNGGFPADSGRYRDEGTRARSEDTGVYARWSGQVDGRIRVNLQGNRATVNTLSGRPVSNMNVDFGGRSGVVSSSSGEFQIRKIQGRGNVRLVETPNDQNGGTLAFEINDDQGGTDYYEVEITRR